MKRPPKDANQQAYRLMHRIADIMADELRRIFTRNAIEVMDCDDIRKEYFDWIAWTESDDGDKWTRRFDRVIAFDVSPRQ